MEPTKPKEAATTNEEELLERRQRRLLSVIALLLLLLLLGWSWWHQKPQTKPVPEVRKVAVTAKAPPARRAAPRCKSSGVEICDGRDNDCDGEVDEGYALACRPCPGTQAGAGKSAPGGVGAPGCVQALLRGGGWFAGKARNLRLGNDHGITLPPKPRFNPYIYIANSGEGTVSKLRIRDGVEVGRFYVGFNPSRTAVDSDGHAWVAMRGGVSDHGPGKILENVIKIDGQCTPTIKPPQTTRECILLDVPEVGNILRGIAADAVGDVWVGAYATSTVYRLHGRTGKLLHKIGLPKSVAPYGLAVDERGYVWVATKSGRLAAVRIDPLTNRVDLEVPIKATRHYRPYGIASDGMGGIWFGSNSPIAFMIDGHTGKLKQFVKVGRQSRGVAIDDRGWLWVADSAANAVIKVARKDGSVQGTYPVGDSPVGVAVDHKGAVWAVNLRSNSATKLSVDGQVLGTYPVGKSPYTYSDMTGSSYRVFKTLKGVFRGTYTTGIKGARWRSVAWDGRLASKAQIALRARAADSADALAKQPWKPVPLKQQRGALGLRGAIIEVEVAMQASARIKPSFVDTLTFSLRLP